MIAFFFFAMTSGLAAAWLTSEEACQLPPAPMSCNVHSESNHYGGFFFNTDSNTCERFSGGEECSSNENVFDSDRLCKMACVCSLPKSTGTCDGEEESFFYDTATEKCEQFVYTGCGGNRNRFSSERRCKEECQCGMPGGQGHGNAVCMASFPSWRYNAAEKVCESFIYGGCGGDNNRFATEEACMKACGSF